MQAWIVGAGKKGSKALKFLLKYRKINIELHICDNDPQKNGKNFNGFIIENQSDAMQNTLDKIFILAVPKYAEECVTLQLREHGFTGKICTSDDVISELSTEKILLEKPILPYLETHVNDHCNLKCKGCGHLSNTAPEKYTNIDVFKKDVIKLSELFTTIKTIRLMGGEPFLNPNLIDYVHIIQRTFPEADLRIVTNGILLPKKSGILKELNHENVTLDISSYPPVLKMYNELEEILKRSEIQYQFSEPVKNFMKFRNPKLNVNIINAYTKCPIKFCTFLRNGEISNCSFPILYQSLETCMKEIYQFSENDKINIYDTQMNGWAILKRLSNPIPACRYCRTSNITEYAWTTSDGSNIKVADWCIEEEE